MTSVATRRDLIRRNCCLRDSLARCPRIACAFARPEASNFRSSKFLRRSAEFRGVHSNAKSPEKYLPETHRRRLRLSRLRQRWLDGHLSGQQREKRLLHARSATAQCSLSQQPRRHVYRRHAKSRPGCRWLWPRCRRRRLRPRWLARHLRHAIRARAFCFTTMAMALLRT